MRKTQSWSFLCTVAGPKMKARPPTNPAANLIRFWALRDKTAQCPLALLQGLSQENHQENAMIATVFLALAVVFIWLLYKGYSTQEIMARGWGSQVRIYQRSSEPIMYWITFWTYLVIVVICVVVGTLVTL